MKRLIIATLLLIFTHSSAFTAVTNSYCNNIKSESECNGTAGCYYHGPSNHCVVCPAGTYNDGTTDGCEHCGGVGHGVEWNPNKSGLIAQSECSFIAKCDATQFFNTYMVGCTACTYKNNANTTPPVMKYSTLDKGYTLESTIYTPIETYTSDEVCKSCGANSTVDDNGLGCTCYKHYHVSGGVNNDIQNDSTDCVPNEYTITLKYKDDFGTQENIIEEYGSGFKNANGDSITSVTPPSRPGYTFTGYWPSYDARYPIIGIDGSLLELSPSTFRADTTLNAKWEIKTFTITYKVTDTHTISQTCTYDSDCIAPAPYSGGIYDGNLFKGWKCNSGCQGTINFDENISTISGGNDMTLTAIWEQCPAGSYCTDILTEKHCPAGSTSDAGSTKKTNCYMSSSDTQIKGNNGTFTLPGTTTIYYHGAQ